MHGPVPHGYAQRTPKKMKAAALRGALSDRARSGNVHVLSTLAIDGTPSTKTALGALQAPCPARRTSWWCSAPSDVLGWKSLRNVPEVHLLTSGQLNTYDVLVSDDVVFTRAALDEFVSSASRGVSVAVAVDAPAGRARPPPARPRPTTRPITLTKKSAVQDEDDTVRQMRKR